MNLFSSFFATSEVEVDDPSTLPASLRDIYLKPHKILGLNPDNPNKDEQISELREIFRKSCLGLIAEFTGFGKGKLTAQQLNLAYHIIRGTVKKSAKYIVENLETDPFLADFQAEDILPVLRPCMTTFPCNRDYRGFRNFAIRYIDESETEAFKFASDQHSPSPYNADVESNNEEEGDHFVFDVHYALRRYRVVKCMHEFLKFNKALEDELLMVPALPDKESVKSNSALPHKMLIGQGLAYYIMRIHQTLADRNLFSPRMLNFLGIDYERVQSEEEGAIVAALDTPELPIGSKWHIIDEKWLLKWRTYVKGRGPRRYYPPGKISNEDLFQAWREFQTFQEEQLRKALEEEENCRKSGKSKKKADSGSKTTDTVGLSDDSKIKGPVRLKLSEHYRCVNYNVWRFFLRVHGGGPNICRVIQDIYSPTPVFSEPDAVVAIQCQMRGHLARKRLNYLRMKLISSTKVGKQILLQMARDEVTIMANKLLEKQRKDRVLNFLQEATVFTQTMWRKKKKLFNDEDKLMKRREEQLIFRKAHRYLRDVAQNQAEGLIVEELQPIIHIGGTNIYQRVLNDSEGGIPFKIMQKPGTEFAMISSAKDESLYFKGSVIRSINQFPTNTLSYVEVKLKLSSASFPLTLVLEKMYSQKNLPLLADLASNFTRQQLREKQQHQREEFNRLGATAGGDIVGTNASFVGGSDQNGSLVHISSSAVTHTTSTDVAMTRDLGSSSAAAGDGSQIGLTTTYDENSYKVGLKDMNNDEKLMYNMFKLALVRGIRLIKHSTNPPLSTKKRHFSILRITNQHLYYRTENSKAIPLDEHGRRLPISSGGDEEEDHYAEWCKFSLYSIKYIREGKESKAALAMGLPVEHCFEIEIEEKGSLLFQFPDNHLIKRYLVSELSSYNAMNLQQIHDFRLPSVMKSNTKKQHHPMHYLHHGHSHLDILIKKRGSIWKVNLDDMQKIIEEMKRLEEFVEKYIDEKGAFGKRAATDRIDNDHGPSEQENGRKPGKKLKKSKIAYNEKTDEIDCEVGEGKTDSNGDDNNKPYSTSEDIKENSEKKSPSNKEKNKDQKIDDDRKGGTVEGQKSVEQGGGTTTNHGLVHLLWQELRYLIREDLEQAKIIKRAKELQIAREQFLQGQEEEEKKQDMESCGPALVPEKLSDVGSKDGSILSSVSSKIKDGISKGTSYLTGRNKKKKRKKPETRIVLDAEGRAIRVNVIDEMKRKEELLSVVETDRILAGHLEHDLLGRKCGFTIWNLKRLVDEIRGSQIFIHKSGLPVKRKNPKVALSRINGGI